MTPTVRPAYRTRGKLLISSASVAVAAALLDPTPAAAQFNGTVPTGGSTGVNTATLGTDQISVTNSSATINWNATSNDFLPSTATQTFTSSLSDYLVLNRITPADLQNPIQINGTLTSYVNGVTSGASNGGKIWFYAPSGILIGGSAKIDVGGLLLTSITPTLNSSSTTGFDASFAPANGDGGSVTIDQGAQIKALQQNSYVAVVAPTIVQGGTVQVDGSVLYLAAETVSEMKLDQGLFDITVPFDGGSGSFVGINHYGTTTGGDTSAQSGNHRIYVAAVPKNDGITMLLGGTIGFDANVAGYENGQIRLSAGSTPAVYTDPVTEDQYETYRPSNSYDATIDIRGGDYLSSVDASATGDVEANSGSGDIAFWGDVDLWSNNGDVRFWASEGDIDVYGNALMISGAGEEHEVLVYAGAGDITFHQFAQLGSNFGWADQNPGDEGDSQDQLTANVRVETSGGIITAQSLGLYAGASGQANAGGGDRIGGDGFGGDITIWAYNGGTIKVLDSLNADSSGTGGDMLNGAQGGGLGDAGDIFIWGTGGTIDVDGSVTLRAVGTGGSYTGTGNPFTAQGGIGRGGVLDAFTTEGGRIEFGNANTSVYVDASGKGGNGKSGGAGYGGNAGFSGIGGTIALPGIIDVNATGNGGNANIGYGGNGGDAYGGTAYIEARAALGTIETSATYSTITGGAATLNASATGGNGGQGYNDGIEVFIAPGRGGNAHAGLYTGFEGSGGAYASAGNAQTWDDQNSMLVGDEQGGQLTLGDTRLYASALGGKGGNGDDGQSGGAGGAAYGGSAQAGNYDPDENGLRNASATYGILEMYADAVGGEGGAAGAGGSQNGDGGEAIAGGFVSCNDGDTCGGVTLNAKGMVTIGSVETPAGLTMHAYAQGGAGGNGGDAQGGHAVIETFGPDSSVTVHGGANLQATAIGGDGDNNGGVATGGLVETILGGGDVTVHGGLTLLADAEGGTGMFGTGGASNGGNGRNGGGATVTVDGGAILTVDGALELDVWGNHVDENGVAIGGASTSEAGTAEGGDATLTITDGTVSAGSLGMRATTWGGNGLDDRSGAQGQGGNVSLTIGSDGGLTVAGATELRANGVGGLGANNSDGVGGDGGSGSGGTVTMTVNGGFDGGTIDVAATGIGGAGGSGSGEVGGNGGLGEGGTVVATIGSAGSLDADHFSMIASGLGGEGGTGTAAGNGGDGTGGTATATVNGDATLGGSLDDEFWSGFVATAFGGGGNGEIGGNATGGSASVTINGSLTTTGLVQSTARAQGGDGDSQGGNATGGVASLEVNGSLESEVVLVATTATGGTGFSFGTGSGGDSTFFINSETGSATVGQWVDVLSDGYDGGPLELGGSYGTGGDASISGPLEAQTVEMAGASVTYSFDVTADNWNFLYYGDADIGDFTATGFYQAEATGSLTTGDITAGGHIALVAGSDLTTGDLLAGYTPVIMLAEATPEDVNLTANGSITTGTVTTPGNVFMQADGNISAGDIDAGLDVGLEADGSIQVNDVTAQNAVFNADNRAYFYGTVSATTISVTSDDIYIASGASLGEQGVTDTIDIFAESNGFPVIIGDVASVNEGQYQLWEDGDIVANTVNFTATGEEGAPDIVIGNVDIEGDTIGQVNINTDGSIIVEGTIDFFDAGADNTLALNAGSRIEVITDSVATESGGAILMTDSDHEVAGTLKLTAHDIWVADSSLISQLEENPNPTNLADLLATNNGAENVSGHLQAGGIEATMLGSSFLVQNTGTTDQLAG